MRKLMRRTCKAFTLIELMIVVVIVAILALVAIPLYRANVESAQFSEGIAGVGSIRSALRVYAAGHNGSYPALSATGAADALVPELGISSADLEGRYFAPANYSVDSAAGGYTVSCARNGQTYEIDQDGAETGASTYHTGQ